ncbi:MAG: hypothetical protein ACRBDI_06000 [Alphaproteobacteria bacterium]
MKKSLAKTMIKSAATLGFSFVVASCANQGTVEEKAKAPPDPDEKVERLGTPPFTPERKIIDNSKNLGANNDNHGIKTMDME